MKKVFAVIGIHLLLFTVKGFTPMEKIINKHERFNKHVNLNDRITSWKLFLASNNWQELIRGIESRISPCGLVYELPNFLNNPNEGFAIVDMRQLSFAEPHYHPDDDIEIYFVLQGSALVVVGYQEYQVNYGDIVVIPPNMAHFTIPKNDFVIAVVNTPPYQHAHYIQLTKSSNIVNFDYEQFSELTNFKMSKESD